ncbi:Uncharacterised protein [Mycobacteroides abscessus subsp. abscessus]|nr:Uncharacterised protein [Mycobacteroides abscessus subsp. abscessus]SKU57502.1 Uncharacterised protein [Mycobacteroides abscessus subsp. abscessus]
MIARIARHATFYTVVALVAFRLGWELSDRLSSYAEEIDPRVEERW